MAYAQKRKFTVDNTKVGGTSGSIPNHAVLISGTFVGAGSDPDLRTTGNGGDIENTDANGGASGILTVPADLAFYDDESGTTQYDHEVVSYNATTGQFEAWVRIPTLNKNIDTDFYMHYSDSGVTTSQENVGGTWNTSYAGVWHLGESSGTRYDSSGNGTGLTDTNTVTSGTGKVGTAAEFEKDNSEYLIDTTPNSAIEINTDLTLKTWINLETLTTTASLLNASIDAGGTLYQWYLTSATVIGFYTDTGVVNNIKTVSWSPSTGTWYQLIVTISGSTLKFYVNGSQQGADQTLTESRITGAANFAIGSNTSGGQSTDALMDEVVVYAGSWDSDYITTVYNNENSPSTFYSISTIGGDPLVNVSETATLTEETTVSVSTPEINVSETTTVTEEVSATVSDPQIIVSETATITEEVIVNVGAVGVFNVSVTEGVTLTEEVSLSVEGPDDLTVSTQETATVTEQITSVASIPGISVSDTATLTEEVSLFVESPENTRNLFVQETVTILEEVTISGVGHNSGQWTDRTNLSGSTWTTDNNYNLDD